MSQESPYSSMVQAYQLRRVREYAAARDALIGQVRTAADAQRYRKLVRTKLRRCFGPMPARTALTPRITGRVERETYVIEKVLYQSRPGLWVSANLYLPRVALDGAKCPAVLGSCGHSATGKGVDAYQTFARTLAHQGFVCLIYDPIGQGERHQYLQEGEYCGAVCEHQIAGNAMSLLGEYFGTWRAWDGIRSLDYLLSRPEVDKRHVGMTGNSGGGTLTTFITMLDDRITMAAPACLGSDYLTNVENELPCDSEQNPPGVISSLLNYADFFIAQAPRPTIILAQDEDFFDLRGIERIHADTRRIFKLLGKPDHARLHRGRGPHGYSAELREAMCRFFREMVGMEDGYSEPAGRDESLETLAAAPGGQVMHIKGIKRVHDFTAAQARSLAKSRQAVTDEKLPAVLGKILTLPVRKSPPTWRALRARHWKKQDGGPGDSSVCFRWGVETEPDILAILKLWRPTYDSYFNQIPVEQGMMLYLPHLSSIEDVRQGHWQPGRKLGLTLDVRGLGESRSWVCGGHESFFAPYDSDFYHSAQHQMMGESYLGRRVHDTLATLDVLADRGAGEIHLMGRGLGGVIAALAGAIHPAVGRVTLKHTLKSFHELTQVPIQRWPLSSLPWGILQTLDLPDVHRYLRRHRRLRMTAPWGATALPHD